MNGWVMGHGVNTLMKSGRMVDSLAVLVKRKNSLEVLSCFTVLHVFLCSVESS